jgi:predicted RNase H-like HicB family nuclease
MRSGTNLVKVLIINIKMKPSKNKILHLPILIEQDEDNVYIVSCPVFKGCHSYGKTVDDALVNIREVIEMCMDEEKEQIHGINRFVGFREMEVSISKETI